MLLDNMHLEACFNAVRETMLSIVELAHDYAHWLLGTPHHSSLRKRLDIQVHYSIDRETNKYAHDDNSALE